MKLSDGEKLILIMLADLHKKMGVHGEIDPDFVRSAIFSDNLWGFNWQYQGMFSDDGAKSPQVVREVCDYLDMWGCIEASWGRLSEAEKAKVATDAAPFATNVRFPGFDGNNEGEYMNVSRFLVNDLKRFSSFKGRGDLNSHSQSIDTYARMYEVFEPMRASLTGGVMNVAQLIEVMNAQLHPSHGISSGA